MTKTTISSKVNDLNEIYPLMEEFLLTETLDFSDKKKYLIQKFVVKYARISDMYFSTKLENVLTTEGFLSLKESYSSFSTFLGKKK
jgi:hypothetical protein